MITTSFGMVLDSNDVADLSLCLTLDEIKVKISSNFYGAWDDVITTSNLTEIMLLTQTLSYDCKGE